MVIDQGKRIVIVVARFSLSGVPLAQIRLANALHRRGMEVEVVFGCCKTDAIYAFLNREIDLKILEKKHTLGIFKYLIGSFLLRNRVVYVLAEDHLCLLGCVAKAIVFPNNSLLICSSRVNPYDTYSKRCFKSKVLRSLFKRFHKQADFWGCVSREMIDQYLQLFGSTTKIGFLPNIVEAEVSSGSITRDIDILIVGSIEPWKGMVFAAQALQIIAESRSWRVVLAGSGSGADLITELLENTENIHFDLVGDQMDVTKFYLRSKVLVHCSLVEGMPNVLLEALACGVRVVAFDVPTGPRELLATKEWGSLVRPFDVVELVRSILEQSDLGDVQIDIAHALHDWSEQRVVSLYAGWMNNL